MDLPILFLPAIWFYQVERHAQMGNFTAPFTLLRLLTLKISYEAAKKLAEPYTKIMDEMPVMRRETVELVERPPRRVGSLCAE